MLIDSELGQIVKYFNGELHIGLDDCMLVGEWALLYSGFNVKEHKSIRIAARREVVPWEVKGDLETYPPGNWLNKYEQLMQDMNYGLIIIPLPQGNWNATTLRRSILHTLDSGAAIRICEPIVEVESYEHILDRYLSMYGERNIYPEGKYQKWLHHVDEVANTTTGGDLETCRRVRALLEAI